MSKEEIKEIFQECLKEILPSLKAEMLKAKYPKWIKGNIMASELLGISPNALCQRVSNGKYIENLHFKKKSHRIYLWDRDILLKERFDNETL